jgi:deoxyribonuclease-4
MRFGCHIRVGEGFPTALAYAAEVGCECVQVFTKSPQQWRAAPIDPARAAEARELLATLGVGPLFTHTAYLINLGSEDDELWKRSAAALADELRRALLLGAVGVVTHIGTNATGDVSRAAANVAVAVAHACVEAGVDAGRLLLLENTAGAGKSFGGSFEELGAVFSLLDHAGFEVGLCLDTCHAHAYGNDVTSESGWMDILDELDSCCGPGRLRLVHANDCVYERGSHRDRHAWIGDGAIGADGFAAMVRQPRLAGIHAITEMPGDAPIKDAENLRRLKALRAACAAPGGSAAPRT